MWKSVFYYHMFNARLKTWREWKMIITRHTHTWWGLGYQECPWFLSQDTWKVLLNDLERSTYRFKEVPITFFSIRKLLVKYARICSLINLCSALSKECLWAYNWYSECCVLLIQGTHQSGQPKGIPPQCKLFLAIWPKLFSYFLLSHLKDLNFWYFFFMVSISIWFLLKKIVSTSLLKFLICLCMLCTLSTRFFGIFS